MRGPGPYARFGKRALDIVAASLGIVLLLPLGGLVAALIWCALGSPVLFRQRRPGLHGVPFTLKATRSASAVYGSAVSSSPTCPAAGPPMPARRVVAGVGAVGCMVTVWIPSRRSPTGGRRAAVAARRPPSGP